MSFEAKWPEYTIQYYPDGGGHFYALTWFKDKHISVTSHSPHSVLDRLVFAVQNYERYGEPKVLTYRETK
jgi:hypothetical protein